MEIFHLNYKIDRTKYSAEVIAFQLAVYSCTSCRIERLSGRRRREIYLAAAIIFLSARW